jgi:hypothetical protein
MVEGYPMAFTFATVASMSNDTGQSSTDFVTSDNTISLNGFAIGSGDLGFWLSSSSFPSPIFLGSIHIGATDPHIWTFDALAGIPIGDGTYTIIVTNGNSESELLSPLDSQSIRIDTNAPNVTIDSVEGDDVLSLPETVGGLQVSGSAAGANGQTITVGVYDGLNNLLFTETTTVSSNTWNVTFNQTQAQTLTGHDYSIRATVDDVAGNTDAAEHDFTSTVCFMAGTMIRTPRGEVAIETLKRGDLVLTADNRAEPIVWVGRQTVSRLFSDPLRVWPIRIKAGALDDNLPARDLLVSPDHALLVGGVLVQAGALVNGSSILREGKVPDIFTYYHVETSDHSLILAEGVPAETFVDNIDRLAFDNWDEHLSLYPNGRAIIELPYPRAQAARQIPRVTREQLSQRSAALCGGAINAA